MRGDVFEWAGKMSDAIQRRARVSELSAGIYRLRNECGSCEHWMKSDQCPRERNVKGQSAGPSCKAMKCEKFEMNNFSKNRAVTLAEELARLEATR